MSGSSASFVASVGPDSVRSVHGEMSQRHAGLSSPASRHARDLAADPRVAAAVHEDYRDWRAIQGLQLSGTAQRLEGAERDAALGLYAAKFPFLNDAALAAALGKAACYRLTPAQVHFVDNSAGFGMRTPVLHSSR